MGAGAAKVKTTMYRFQYEQMLVYLTVADDGCVPILYEGAGMNKKGGINILLRVTYIYFI